MKDRGMMKWAPYKSLDQQSDYLSKMNYERNKQERPLMSNERAEEINALLVDYHGQKVKLCFFDDGYIHEIEGDIRHIDIIYKYIDILDYRIVFKDIDSIFDANF